MRKLRGVLQTAQRLPVPEIHAGQQGRLFDLSDSPPELQKIPKDRIGAYYTGYLRLQVRIRPVLLRSIYRCLRGVKDLPTNSNKITIPIMELCFRCARCKTGFAVVPVFKPPLIYPPGLFRLRRLKTNRLPITSSKPVAGSGTSGAFGDGLVSLIT